MVDMDDQKNAPQAELAPIEMKLKKKYTTKRPGNKGISKKNNSGGTGKAARAKTRGVYVCAAICPEQYGLWKAWMLKQGLPVLG
jgi:hypothetical protein